MTWTCPQCHRTFKRRHQNHYCGKAPQSVEDYIQNQDTYKQEKLNTIRHIILDNVLDIHEYISWHMPTYKKDDKSVSFVANKNDISFYIDNECIEKFLDDLQSLKTKKNTIYLRYDQDLPIELLTQIIQSYFNHRGD